MEPKPYFKVNPEISPLCKMIKISHLMFVHKLKNEGLIASRILGFVLSTSMQNFASLIVVVCF